MNLLKVWINESMPNALVTSMSTALLVKLVNRAQYFHSVQKVWTPFYRGSHYNLFKSNCLSLMVYGPNISTPLCVNGDTSRHLTSGKSAIFCTPNLPYSLKQLKHLYVIPLTTMLALSIQNPICLKLFKVIPIPQWATLSWYHCMIFPDMLPCFGRTTGWASLWESPNFPNLPPTRNKPSLCKKGSNYRDCLIYCFNSAVWVCT